MVDLLKQRRTKLKLMRAESTTSYIKSKIDKSRTDGRLNTLQKLGLMAEKLAGHDKKVISSDELNALLQATGVSTLEELMSYSSGTKADQIQSKLFHKKGSGADPYRNILKDRKSMQRDEEKPAPFFSDEEEKITFTEFIYENDPEMQVEFDGIAGKQKTAAGQERSLEDIDIEDGMGFKQDTEIFSEVEGGPDEDSPVGMAQDAKDISKPHDNHSDSDLSSEEKIEDITSEELATLLHEALTEERHYDMWGNEIGGELYDEEVPLQHQATNDDPTMVELPTDSDDIETNSDELALSSEDDTEDALSFEPIALSLMPKEMRKNVKKHLENKERLVDQTHLKDLKMKLFKTDPMLRYSKEGILDLKMLNLKSKPPTLEGALQEADEIIATQHHNLKRAVARDNKQDNWHFKPRYLDKDQTYTDNAYTRTENDLDVFPQIFNMSPRIPSDFQIMVENTVSQYESVPFRFPTQQSTAVEAYSAMRGDPGYTHFISNHLKYWRDAVGREFSELRDMRVNKNFNFLSWERLAPKPDNLQRLKKKRDPFDSKGRAHTSGKRKTAVALAWLSPGTGKVTVNHKSFIDYFDMVELRDRVITPFKMTATSAEFDLMLKCYGGGISGQAQAAQLALSRAIIKFMPEFRNDFERRGMLKRDPRMVERKKTSKYKARKSYTFVKR